MVAGGRERTTTTSRPLSNNPPNPSKLSREEHGALNLPKATESESQVNQHLASIPPGSRSPMCAFLGQHQGEA